MSLAYELGPPQTADYREAEAIIFKWQADLMLAMTIVLVALLWTLPGSHPPGRLPKYNPERRSTFSIADSEHVCLRASAALHIRRVIEIGRWIDKAAINTAPRKNDQDWLDACL